jgi:hypothetical protein
MATIAMNVKLKFGCVTTAQTKTFVPTIGFVFDILLNSANPIVLACTIKRIGNKIFIVEFGIARCQQISQPILSTLRFASLLPVRLLPRL